MIIEKGKLYEVTIDDCCVEGKFKARLTSVKGYNSNSELVEIDEFKYGSTLIFDNGVTLECNGGVSLELADFLF